MTRSATALSVRAVTRPQPSRWLPAGKTAAVCLSVDDIHPSTSRDAYEAGGDLAEGALGRLARLLARHPYLKATLAVTPDWRLNSLVPDTGLLRRIPWINRHVPWTRLHPAGHYRLDRHPRLVAYLNSLERCEAVLHGLAHSHVGPHLAVEFQEQSEEECVAMLERGLEIFHAAKLRFARGFLPPSWNAPPALLGALRRLKFEFLNSARDLRTPVSAAAVTGNSGLKGVSMIYPQVLGPRGPVHVSCNFQATSSFERAVQILDLGGVLHVKAHIFKAGGGHLMLDGLDDLYCNYLDLLFTHLHRHYGSQLWWAQLSEVAAGVRGASA